MPYKLTEDGQGLVTVKTEDGLILPILIDPENQNEAPHDGDRVMATMKKQREIEAEARKAKKEMSDELTKLKELMGDIEDFAKFKEQALTDRATIDGLSDKETKTAAELEEKRKLTDDAWKSKITAQEEMYKKEIEERDAQIKKTKTDFDNYLVERLFFNSSFIKDETHMPPDIAYKAFSDQIRIREENGKRTIYGVGQNDLDILSQKTPGEPAVGDELVELLVKSHPSKDAFLKNNKPSGSGQGGTSDAPDPQTLLGQMYPTMQ